MQSATECEWLRPPHLPPPLAVLVEPVGRPPVLCVRVHAHRAHLHLRDGDRARRAAHERLRVERLVAVGLRPDDVVAQWRGARGARGVEGDRHHRVDDLEGAVAQHGLLRVVPALGEVRALRGVRREDDAHREQVAHLAHLAQRLAAHLLPHRVHVLDAGAQRDLPQVQPQHRVRGERRLDLLRGGGERRLQIRAHLPQRRLQREELLRRGHREREGLQLRLEVPAMRTHMQHT